MTARLPTREHHVAGQPPAWSLRFLGFRHFDGTPCNWKRKPMAVRRQPSRRARLTRAFKRIVGFARACWNFEAILLAPSSNRRDMAVFVVGMVWGVMCAIGMMAAWGIHP